MDTRTRCIVLFRECVVLIAKKDMDAVFSNIADGSGARFRFSSDRQSLSPDLKREIEDVDQFFKHNFPHSPAVNRRFNEILFSKLHTAKEPVTLKNVAIKTEHQGKLHRIRIKIPEVDDRRFSELRFVEVGRRIYWIPFGW